MPNSTCEQISGPARRLEHATVLLALVLIGLATAGAIGALAAQAPLVAVAIVLVIPLTLSIIRWPDIATLLAMLILFSNAAVVAVRYHGVPYVVGLMAPPMLMMITLSCHVLFHRQRLLFISPFPLVVLYFVIQLLGAFFATYPEAAIGALKDTLIEGVGLYLLVTNVVRTPEMMRRVIWSLLLVGALLGGLSTYQQITLTHDNNYGGFAQVPEGSQGFRLQTSKGQLRQHRSAGPLGEQNRYAQNMLMLVPLGLFRFSSERSGWPRALALVATGLVGCGCVLTFSRGAAVGFALLLVLMTFMRYIETRQLVAIAVGAVLLFLAFPQFGDRLASLRILGDVALPGRPAGREELDGAIAGRATSMLAAARVAADYPWLGVGPGNFKYYNRDYAKIGGFRAQAEDRKAHCLYLEIAAEHGVAGFICFLAIIGLTLRNLASTRRHWMHTHPEIANTATGFILAIAAYLITGLFLHLSYIRYFWLMLALAAATNYVASQISSPAAEGTSRPRRFSLA